MIDFRNDRFVLPILCWLGIAISILAEDITKMPGQQEHVFNLPFREEYQRQDPKKDGWNSEVLQSLASKNLKLLFNSAPGVATTSHAAALLSEAFTSTALMAGTELTFEDVDFKIRRSKDLRNLPETFSKRQFGELRRQIGIETDKHTKVHRHFKVISTEMEESNLTTLILFESLMKSASGSSQVNAKWQAHWKIESPEKIKLLRLVLMDYQQAESKLPGGALFGDVTRSVFGDQKTFEDQIKYGVEHWRHRLERSVSPSLVAANGLAIGDINGDGLEDVFMAQDRHLPDLLLIQQPDGSVLDAAERWGIRSLAVSTSALLLDLDNDGDQDLVVGGEGEVRFFANQAMSRFELKYRLKYPSRVESMAAADYDQDGRLDLYLCGHTRATVDQSESVLGIPIPVYDAQNGQANMLVRNIGAWNFRDETEASGLMTNNNRFSYAAAWEDYDNDGDQDLYVANDFGRNNLYRNEDGRFEDVAAEAGVEDIASGMSVAWADVDQDGWMDLYVSNMFSSAGNRLTYQRDYQIGDTRENVDKLQRMARGNTLFMNQGNSRFADASSQSNTTMGRWAWSSQFGDINNDGFEDLLIANGFVTNTRLDDL
jgi:hypothetical protein